MTVIGCTCSVSCFITSAYFKMNLTKLKSTGSIIRFDQQDKQKCHTGDQMYYITYLEDRIPMITRWDLVRKTFNLLTCTHQCYPPLAAKENFQNSLFF